jgi:hypothetical protein
MFDSDSEYDEPQYGDTPLYENCTHIGGCCPEIYAYTPQHALDENLFRELVSNKRFGKQSDGQSSNPYIRIAEEMECNDFPEQFSVGKICVSNPDKHPKCCFCKLALPVDLTYYTWPINNAPQSRGDLNKNACYLCYINSWMLCIR